MTVTSAYTLMAILVAPALEVMGVSALAAHMLVFWYSQSSNISPPVCMAAFAGASIARSDPVHTGFAALRFSAFLFVVPVLFQTVVALAEAMAMGEAAGVARRPLFEALAKGSADSFALRNHGMKAMVPDDFPASAFPTDYALKDIGYALDLARQAGIDAPGATLAEARLRAAREAGFGDRYFPVLARVVDRR